MAAAFNYFTTSVLAHAFRTNSWTKPTTLYCGFTTATPLVTQTGSTVVEVTGSGYARQAVTVSDSAFSFTAPTLTLNTSLSWTATGDWNAPITYGFWADSLTGGNGYIFFPLAVTRSVLNGDVITIAPSQWTVTLS